MVRIDIVEHDRTTPDMAPEPKAPSLRRRPGSKRYGRLNGVTGRLLVFLVLASGIPVASNRPVFWLIWTFLVGLGALIYLVRAQMLMGKRRSLQINQFRLFFGVALLVPVFAVVQWLPIGDYLPAALQTLPPSIPEILRPATLSVMPEASLIGAVRAIGFLIFLMLVIEVGTQAERTHRLGLILLAGITLHAIFGIVALRLLGDLSIVGEKEDYLGVLTGTFVNRNSIATYLGFGIVVGLAFALVRGHQTTAKAPDRTYATLFTPQRLEVLGLWLVVALLAVAILLTQSRMGAVATAIGAFVCFLVLRISFRTPPLRVLLESCLALAVLLALLIPTAGIGTVERALFSVVDSTVRINLYLQTWGMILDRPLTGFGYDAFAPAFELYRDEPLVSENYADLAHNTYLALWSEQGMIVGSIPMVLCGWAGWMIVQRLRSGDGDLAMNAAALGVIMLGAVHSLVDFSLEIPANVYCFLLIVGLAMARPRLPGQGRDTVMSEEPQDRTQP